MRKNHYLIAAALCVAALAASTTGCELITSVDRSRIKGEGGSGGSGNTGGGGNNAGGGGGMETGTCTDNQKNGKETDVDCGGGDCPACAQGKLCAAGGDCETTFCATGVCCDTACDGVCQACAATEKASGADSGKCEQAKTGFTCDDAQACADGVETVGDTCQDDGTCKDNGTKECGGFACNPETSACRTECAAATDCALCNACDANACTPVPAGTSVEGCTGTDACDGAGACKKAIGQACAADTDCASAHCADGVCCDTGCDSGCQSCALAALEGTCSPLEVGTADPVCGPTNTTCNDAGECKLPAGATCAAPAECASGVCTFQRCGATP